MSDFLHKNYERAFRIFEGPEHAWQVQKVAKDRSAMIWGGSVRSGGKVVKNLGWLLRNWKGVLGFMVEPDTAGGRAPGSGLILTAAFAPGYTARTYVTPYASGAVLRDFLDRPVFRGVGVYWHGRGELVIGSREWRAMRESYER